MTSPARATFRWASLGVLAAAAAMLILPSTASAGRVVVTGHDADDHCSGATPEQCHYFKVVTRYVRNGAPNPNKKVLLLDCNGGVVNALDNAFGAGVVPRRAICPSEFPDAFRGIGLTIKNFSAIIVGSSCDDSDTDGVGDNTLNLTDDLPNGCDEPGGAIPDTDLINERKGDIKRFFNRGGGIFAISGGDNGDGAPASGPDRYYNFLPLTAEGVAVNPPFCLTNAGIALGLHDQDCPDASKHNGTQNDINCCETHNSFAEPPPASELRVAERDTQGFAETMFADAQIRGGQFVDDDPEDTRKPRIRVRGVPDGCTRRDFEIEVDIRDRSALRRVRVLLDGRVIERTRRKHFDVEIPARRLVSGGHRIVVKAQDREGNRAKKTRRFTRCTRAPGFTG